MMSEVDVGNQSTINAKKAGFMASTKTSIQRARTNSTVVIPPQKEVKRETRPVKDFSKVTSKVKQ